MYGPGTGIGPALRKARQHRGKSIEEVSRDTCIRAEYLQALEREAFGSMRDDVYVRGFLRSYSSYLGLNADKVVSVYNRVTGRDPDEVHEPLPPATIRQPGIRLLHRRGNWRLAAGAAVVALAGAAAIGLLSREGSVPLPERLPTTTPGALTQTEKVTATLVALKDVPAVVVADGVRVFSGVLHKGHTRTFSATGLLRVRLDQGRAAELSVNGGHLGAVGSAKHPYSATFQPQDYRNPSPGA